MVSSVSNTVYGVINDAMLDAGKLAEGEEPNSEQLATNMRRLNDIINLMQTEGCKLFLLQDVAVTLVADQAVYTIKTGGDVDMTKPLNVVDAYIVNTSNVRRPLIPMSWNDWVRLSQITGNSGQINSYFVDKQSTVMNVHFWNPPNTAEAASTAHLILRTQVTNPINLEEDMAFPQEWRIALRWRLADEISTGQPQAIMDRCAARAAAYSAALENFDVEETSTRFAPSFQGTHGGGFL